MKNNKKHLFPNPKGGEAEKLRIEFLKQTMFPALLTAKKFNLGIVSILAQAALETGWGVSNLAKNHFNYFGLTGHPNTKSDYWTSKRLYKVQNTFGILNFRSYDSIYQSFFDFGSLLRRKYRIAASLSFRPYDFANAISHSSYISEKIGDSRIAYNKALQALANSIGQRLPDLLLMAMSMEEPVDEYYKILSGSGEQVSLKFEADAQGHHVNSKNKMDGDK